MEEWKPIRGFEGYSVSDEGRVRNDVRDRNMAQLVNNTGTVHVSLQRGKTQFRRSVALLVATHFLPTLSRDFDTPIHLDGDGTNNHVSNLMWRPRWFAIKYKQQFYNGERGFSKPVMETHSKERFDTSWDAAMKYGLIDREIMVATVNRTYVWPTYQVFCVID